MNECRTLFKRPPSEQRASGRSQTWTDIERQTCPDFREEAAADAKVDE